jgi:pimeloyl-ACP methyl ester carboxylesterase
LKKSTKAGKILLFVDRKYSAFIGGAMLGSLRLLTIAFAVLSPMVASAAETVQRPLIIVPGILGSKLCTGSGEVVWGTGRSLSNFTRLQLDGPAPEKLVPCGIIDKVEVFGPIYSIKAYKALLDHLKEIGFNESNLHLFSYDWRMSNFDSANQFKAFIDDRIKDGRIKGKFDIIAHSMGGIVTRIYVDQNKDTPINQVIYMGTPFLGSANTLGTLSEGWGAIQNTIAGGIEKIREVIVSLPGFLELLPRYEKCCYVRANDTSRKEIDVFNADQWKALGWLPKEVSENPARFARFRDNLAKAGSLSALLRSPIQQFPEIKFVGNAHPTRVYIGVRESATRPSRETWHFTKDPGDGTVAGWSAARNPSFNSLSGSNVAFSEHATLFDDKWAKERVKLELLAITPTRREEIDGPGNPVIGKAEDGSTRTWTIRSIELVPTQVTYHKGELLEAEVLILASGGRQGFRKGLVVPEGRFNSNIAEKRVSVTETTSDEDLVARQLRFKLSVLLDTLPIGAGELTFSLPTVRSDANAVARIAIIE